MRLACMALWGAVCAAQTRPAVIFHGEVYHHPAADPYDPANRNGFNHAPNIVALPDGRLMAAWFSGPFEASVSQMVLASYSSDDGAHWSAAETFSDLPRTSDFDPAFLRDGGRVWAFFSAGRWNRYPFTRDERNQVGEKSFQIYVRTSDDSGRTWSATAPAQVERGYNCRNNGIRLSSGELLLPLAQLRGADSGVLRSADGGRTWRRIGGVTTPMGQDEPAIVELRSGAVMMILRSGGGRMWRTISRDKGETWMAPVETGMVAARSSHSVVRLRDGRLVLTHNASAQHRTPLTLRVSADDAETWGEPVTLAEVPLEDARGARMQVSYPSVAELADGTLAVVWSYIGIADTEQYGDIRFARVRLPR